MGHKLSSAQHFTSTVCRSSNVVWEYNLQLRRKIYSLETLISLEFLMQFFVISDALTKINHKIKHKKQKESLTTAGCKLGHSVRLRLRYLWNANCVWFYNVCCKFTLIAIDFWYSIYNLHLISSQFSSQFSSKLLLMLLTSHQLVRNSFKTKCMHGMEPSLVSLETGKVLLIILGLGTKVHHDVQG